MDLLQKQNEQTYIQLDMAQKEEIKHRFLEQFRQENEQLKAWNTKEHRAAMTETLMDKQTLVDEKIMDMFEEMYPAIKVKTAADGYPVHTEPKEKFWTKSRSAEKKEKEDLNKRYEGTVFSTNSVREMKLLNKYKKFHSEYLEHHSKQSEQIDKYEKKTFKEGRVTKDDINDGLMAFLCMTESGFLHTKRRGVLGTESELEKKDPAAYNRQLFERYTKHKANSKEHFLLMDELANKLLNFEIKPEMMTDKYMANHGLRMQRYADMLSGFAILYKANPGYKDWVTKKKAKEGDFDEGLLNLALIEGRILQMEEPVHSFLDAHYKRHHIKKSRGRDGAAGYIPQEPGEAELSNEEFLKTQWDAMKQAGFDASYVMKDYAAKRMQKSIDAATMENTAEMDAELVKLREEMLKKPEIMDVFGPEVMKIYQKFSQFQATRTEIAARLSNYNKELNRIKEDKGHARLDAVKMYRDFLTRSIRDLSIRTELLETQSSFYKTALTKITNLDLNGDLTGEGILEVMKKSDTKAGYDAFLKVLQLEGMEYFMELDDVLSYNRLFNEAAGKTVTKHKVMKEGMMRVRNRSFDTTPERIRAIEENEESREAKELTLDEMLLMTPEQLTARYALNGNELDLNNPGLYKAYVELGGWKKLSGIVDDMQKNPEKYKKYSKEDILDLQAKSYLMYYHATKFRGLYEARKSMASKFLPDVAAMQGGTEIEDGDEGAVYDEKTLKSILGKISEKKEASTDKEEQKKLDEMFHLVAGFADYHSEQAKEIKVFNEDAYRSMKMRAQMVQEFRSIRSNYMEDAKMPLLVDFIPLVVLKKKVEDAMAKREHSFDVNELQLEMEEFEKGYDEKIEGASDAKEKEKLQKEKSEALKMQVVRKFDEFIQRFERIRKEDMTTENMEQNFSALLLDIRWMTEFVPLMNPSGKYGELLFDGISPDEADYLSKAVDTTVAISKTMDQFMERRGIDPNLKKDRVHYKAVAYAEAKALIKGHEDEYTDTGKRIIPKDEIKIDGLNMGILTDYAYIKDKYGFDKLKDGKLASDAALSKSLAQVREHLDTRPAVPKRKKRLTKSEIRDAAIENIKLQAKAAKVKVNADLAYEMMDMMQEEDATLNDRKSANLIRTKYLDELAKEKIDPKHFMRLFRTVDKNTAGTEATFGDAAARLANQAAINGYFGGKEKRQRVLMDMAYAINLIDVTEDMLNDKYLSKPENFRYAYTVMSKLMAFSEVFEANRKFFVDDGYDLYTKDKGKTALLTRIGEQFSAQNGARYQAAWNVITTFAAKNGVSMNGTLVLDNLTKEQKPLREKEFEEACLYMLDTEEDLRIFGELEYVKEKYAVNRMFYGTSEDPIDKEGYRKFQTYSNQKKVPMEKLMALSYLQAPVTKSITGKVKTKRNIDKQQENTMNLLSFIDEKSNVQKVFETVEDVAAAREYFFNEEMVNRLHESIFSEKGFFKDGKLNLAFDNEHLRGKFDADLYIVINQINAMNLLRSLEPSLFDVEFLKSKKTYFEVWEQKKGKKKMSLLCGKGAEDYIKKVGDLNKFLDANAGISNAVGEVMDGYLLYHNISPTQLAHIGRKLLAENFSSKTSQAGMTSEDEYMVKKEAYFKQRAIKQIVYTENMKKLKVNAKNGTTTLSAEEKSRWDKEYAKVKAEMDQEMKMRNKDAKAKIKSIKK